LISWDKRCRGVSGRLLRPQRFCADVLIAFVGPHRRVAAIRIGYIERYHGRPVSCKTHRDRLSVTNSKSLERISANILDYLPVMCPVWVKVAVP
jgi:hypothetical protein